MSSLMTLTTAYIKDIRRGRWMVVFKHGEQDRVPQWHMWGVDAVMGDHLMIATNEARYKLMQILAYDSKAQLVSVRETEPLKTLFIKSGAVNTICDCIRHMYEDQTGILLADALKEQEVSAS